MVGGWVLVGRVVSLVCLLGGGEGGKGGRGYGGMRVLRGWVPCDAEEESGISPERRRERRARVMSVSARLRQK